MWDEKYADIKHMTTITTAKAEQVCTSICPGCREKTPQTRQLLNSTDLVFTVLETRKTKIEADAESGEDQFLTQRIPSYCGRDEESLQDALAWALILLLRVLLLRANHLPKVPVLSCWRPGLQHKALGEGIQIFRPQ